MNATTPKFDPDTLQELTAAELREIESGCAEFNTNFNSVFSAEQRYQWDASPRNLANLDYDFYEFGGGHWYRDSGYGFTCAWGQILVISFGFQWMKMEGGENLRDYVLKHDEARYLLFPWQTLWGVVESAGNQTEKAAGAWMRILNEVDAVLGIPTGWHIVTDAIRGDLKAPKRVVAEMKALYDRPGWRFEVLGLWPYEWQQKADWEQVISYLKTKQMELDGWNEHG